MRRIAAALLPLAVATASGCNFGLCDGDVTITTEDELNAARECPRIEGTLTIGPSDLPAVDSMAGISGIAGDLRVVDNTTLKDLDGLIEVIEIGGDLIVENNDVLQDISGIHQLSRLDGDVSVKDNPQLIHLAGIIRVTSIAGSFTLERNDRLDDMQGLREVAEVGGAFTIRENASLEAFDGADALARVGSLTIRDNPMLPRCAAENLADRVEIAEGEADLGGNEGTTGCS